jgi:hypothetical protein
VSWDLGFTRSLYWCLNRLSWSWVSRLGFLTGLGRDGDLLGARSALSRRDGVASIGRDGVAAGGLVAWGGLGRDRITLAGSLRAVARRGDIGTTICGRGDVRTTVLRWLASRIGRGLASRVRGNLGLVVSVTVLRSSDERWESDDGNLGELHFVYMFFFYIKKKKKRERAKYERECVVKVFF